MLVFKQFLKHCKTLQNIVSYRVWLELFVTFLRLPGALTAKRSASPFACAFELDDRKEEEENLSEMRNLKLWAGNTCHYFWQTWLRLWKWDWKFLWSQQGWLKDNGWKVRYWERPVLVNLKGAKHCGFANPGNVLKSVLRKGKKRCAIYK